MFKLLARIAYTLAVLIQSLLAVRFALILFNINSKNEVVKWIMSTSQSFVSPFYGILDNPILVINGFTADLTIVVAWFFYLIAGFIAIEILKAFSID